MHHSLDSWRIGELRYSFCIALQDLVIGLLIVFLFFCVLSVLVHIWMRTPYGGTPKVVLEAMLQAAELRPGMRVLDLGAGDGRLLIAAKRACPDISVCGCELAPLIYLMGRMRIAIAGEDVRLRFGNAFREDLSDVDVIFAYLFPGILERLREKFQRELKLGARVISHRFRIPGWEEEAVHEVPYGKRSRKIFVYRR